MSVGSLLGGVVRRPGGSGGLAPAAAAAAAAAAVRSEFPGAGTLSSFSPSRLPTGTMGGKGLNSSVSPPTVGAAAAEATSDVRNATDQILSESNILTTESINQQAMAMCHTLLGDSFPVRNLKLFVNILRNDVIEAARVRDNGKGLDSLGSLELSTVAAKLQDTIKSSSEFRTVQVKVEKFLRNALVSEVDRQVKEFPDGGPDTGGGVHTQSFGQVVCAANGSFFIDRGHTPSQEEDKFALKHGQDKEVHAANLGHVKDNAGNVLLTRSARATSPAKVLEVQLHGALAMGAAALAALPRDDAGRPIFKMEITSFMDDSTLKNVGEMFAERSELDFLGDIQRSISELYPEKTPTMVVHLDFGLGGASMEVVLARPTLVQVPLSKLGAFNAVKSRTQNQPVYREHAIALGNQFAASDSEDLNSVGNALLAFATSTKTGAAVFASDFLSIGNLTTLKTAGRLTDSQFKAINALKLTLTGSTLTGNAFNEPTNSAFQLVYDSALKRELKIQSALQCKSGQDRTGTGVALEVALQRLAAKGRPFDPETTIAAELDDFKLEFTKAVDQFCADSNTLCRDDEALKAKNHPFFNEHYVTDRSARRGFGLSETSPVNIRTVESGGGGVAAETCEL
jgi:hypothetical protein